MNTDTPRNELEYYVDPERKDLENDSSLSRHSSLRAPVLEHHRLKQMHRLPGSRHAELLQFLKAIQSLLSFYRTLA